MRAADGTGLRGQHGFRSRVSKAIRKNKTIWASWPTGPGGDAGKAFGPIPSRICPMSVVGQAGWPTGSGSEARAAFGARPSSAW